MTELVTVTGLIKKYGETLAVNNLSLKIKPGEIYGLLGPNGAGKTTTVRCIMGIIPRNSGDIRIFSKDPLTDGILTKSRIGYVPEEVILYDSLSPREFFNFVGSIRHLNKEKYEPRLQELVRAFNIEKHYDTTIAALSHGTKQKVAVIAALFHEPDLLVFDEPFSGIDARSVRILKDLMRVHVEKEGSVLFSTHIMEVAERICDRIGIINEGELVAEGSVDGLRDMIKTSGGSLEEIFLRVTDQEDEVLSTLTQLRKAFNNDIHHRGDEETRL